MPRAAQRFDTDAKRRNFIKNQFPGSTVYFLHTDSHDEWGGCSIEVYYFKSISNHPLVGKDYMHVLRWEIFISTPESPNFVASGGGIVESWFEEDNG